MDYIKVIRRMFEIETPAGTVVVKGNDLGVEIGIRGYGVKTEDNGAPIYLDTFSELPMLYVWADINQEDATHKIDISKALESNRSDRCYRLVLRRHEENG
jgi:hypothetical protein